MNYGNQGDFTNAIYAFDQALRLKPDYAQAWLYKGVALARIGRKNEAMQCVGLAFRFNPGYADNPGIIEALRGLGLPLGPAPQRAPSLVNPLPHLNRGSGDMHSGPDCQDDQCYQCGGTGEIAASGNAYSGAGYRPARPCSNCRGTGRVRRCY